METQSTKRMGKARRSRAIASQQMRADPLEMELKYQVGTTEYADGLCCDTARKCIVTELLF